MGTDTTYIDTAARNLDGYAEDLREHARSLRAAQGAKWVSDSGTEYRRLLGEAATAVDLLVKGAEGVASAMRLHREAVAANPLSHVTAQVPGVSEVIDRRIVQPTEKALEPLVDAAQRAGDKIDKAWDDLTSPHVWGREP